jgi:site-specific DNA-methyltransferase (adenine-specific)
MGAVRHDGRRLFYSDEAITRLYLQEGRETFAGNGAMTLPNPYYEDSAVTIYHGDCREILPDLPKVDLVLTDPPYGIGKGYGSYKDTHENLKGMVGAVFADTARLGRVIFITPGVQNISLYPNPRWILAWVYGTTNTYGEWGFNSWQPILAYGDCPYLKNKMGARMDIIRDSKTPDKNGHPCPKPISFIGKLIIRGSVFQSDTILDPFMGSGTTLRAAKDLGRKAIGIEIEEKYCEIAAKRMGQEVLAL